ncbi:MAG: hypothetical protein AAF583_11150 [Pseudomonadota bacterium]
MSCTEINQHGHQKQSFEIAQDICDALQATDPRISIAHSWGDSKAVAVGDQRVAGGKFCGRPEIMGWNTKATDLLQGMFNKQQLLKIAHGVCKETDNA